MIWVTAHTTQFSTPGSFSYLLAGSGPGTGSGLLQQGGSYVTLEDFSTGDFSIVIEKMSRDHSPCCRPSLPPFAAEAEVATFTLTGAPAKAQTLQLWRTHFSFGAPGDETSEFMEQTPIQVVGGKFSLLIEVDTLYTVTTLTTGQKGSFPAPPAPATFPASHVDDFNSCAQSSEAAYFSDQNGAWECEQGDAEHGMVMNQKVPLLPIAWGGDIRPHSLLGSRDLADSSFSIDILFPAANASALVGARLAGTTNSVGIIWAVDASGSWNITGQMSSVQKGPAQAQGQLSGGWGVGVWHRVRLDVNGSSASLWVDGSSVLAGFNVSWSGATGHSGIGTIGYGHYTSFDNVELYSTQTSCSSAAPAAGAALAAVSCASEVGPRPGGQLSFQPLSADTCPYGSPCSNSTGTFSLASDASLCLSSYGSASELDWPVLLEACDATSAKQQWTQAYTMLYSSSIQHAASGRKLCTRTVDIGSPAVASAKGSSSFCGDMVYVGDEQEIVTINAGSICVGVC
jgi:hypothetical protein